MNTWPYAVLPDPTVDYSAASTSSVIRTKMDSGRTRQRQRFTTDMRTLSVQWIFSEFQWAMFQSFHRYKLSLGADFFFIDLWLGQGPLQCKARFVEGEYRSQYQDGKYMVNATIEVEEVPVFSESLFDLFISDGVEAVEEIEEAAESLHELVHTTLPESGF